MNAEENRLSIKIDADLSEFDNKIDAMELRLESLKREIADVSLSISSQISAFNSYVERTKKEALAKTFTAPANNGAGRLLDESESKMRRQAAMITK